MARESLLIGARCVLRADTIAEVFGNWFLKTVHRATRKVRPMNAPAASALEIFKAGTHTSEDGRVFTFTAAVVDEIAETYDPALSEAPLVIGHPTTDAPAYGWAQGLHAKEGVLYAQPHQVEPQFAEMVNAGRYKKISASIYLPDSPGNPKPGKHYLKHIGLLGAAKPAVQGMRSASFAADDGAVSFSMPLAGLGWTLTDLMQRFRDWLIDKEGLPTADQVIPQWQIRAITEHTADRDEPNAQAIASYAAASITKSTEKPMSDPKTEAAKVADFAAREQTLTDQAAALAAREKAIADREIKARQDDAAAFCESLVADGKLLPVHKAATIALLMAQPAATAPLSFAEGDQSVSKPAGDVLRALLTSMPKQVDFSEKSKGAGTDDAAVSFAAPPGTTVDAAGMKLHGLAIAYQREHPGTDYLTAVKAVGG